RTSPAQPWLLLLPRGTWRLLMLFLRLQPTSTRSAYAVQPCQVQRRQATMTLFA
ncbi:ANKRD17, partial [Symbiodinium sp. CCMP2456]